MSKLTDEQVQLIDSLLLKANAEGLTTKEIARQAGCSIRSISNYRSRLAKKLIRESHKAGIRKAIRPAQIISNLATGEGGTLSGPDQKGLPSAGDILAAFPDAKVMTPQETMLLMSILAQEANPQVQIAAVKTLEDLRIRHAPPASLGPPVPMTDEEKIFRLARLMEAVGPDIAAQAARKAFPCDLSSPVLLPSSLDAPQSETPNPSLSAT